MTLVRSKRKKIVQLKNRIEINSDGINAYAKISVNASQTGIKILSGFLILEIIIVLGLLWQIKSEEVISMIIPILIVLVVFVGLPIKYLLWNLYGKEELIVNTKSISWSYDYGFFKTNLQTVKYHRLGTGYEKVKGDDDKEVGKLIFYNYREEDNLPEFIHQTTILLNKKEIEKFDKEISDVFANEFLNKNGFVPFSIN